MIASTLSSGGVRAVPLPRNFREWPDCMQRRFREHAAFAADSGTKEHATEVKVHNRSEAEQAH